MEDDDSSSTGRWTTEEHNLFEDGLRKYGKQWKRIAEEIPTRTVVQIRTHAQKYFLKLAKIEPATSTSIALKPPNTANNHHHNHHGGTHGANGGSGGASTGHDLPLSLARKKRSVGKSTYRRRVMSVDSEEEEAEATRQAKKEQAEEEEEDEEREDEQWDWTAKSYNTTTLTSRGRVSRPPRNKAAFVSLPTSPSGRSVAAAAGGKSGKHKSSARRANHASTGQQGAFGSNSRVSSCSSITTGMWGGLGTHPPALMVKIPNGDEDELLVHEGLFAAEGGFPGLLENLRAAGGGVEGQTPTGVADLFPGSIEYLSGHSEATCEEDGEEEEEEEGEEEGEEEDSAYDNYRPDYLESMATTHGTVSCASSTTSSSAHSSSAHGEGEEDEEGVDRDDAFYKLQALAGRAAPEWAEALNEALGALENGSGEQDGHLQQLQSAAGPTGHGSMGSMTDSGSNASSTTGGYLPSDESDDDKVHRAAAAGPVGSISTSSTTTTRFLEEEPPAKRTRLSHHQAGADVIKGSSTVPFLVSSSAQAAVASSSTSAEEEEDYGYFTTTEDDLNHFMLNMLDDAVASPAGEPASL